MSNRPQFGSGQDTGAPIINKLRTIQGTAAPEPGQGDRSPDKGADPVNTIEGRGTMEQK